MLHKIILIILFEIILYTNCANEYLIIKKISPGSTNVTWIPNFQYLYYIDIRDYYVQEENVIEFTVGFNNIIVDTSLYILTTNKTEKEIKEGLIIPFEGDPNRNISVKKRLSSELFIYANTFQKKSYDQKYFLILIVPNKIDQNYYIHICLSKRVENYTITKNDLENNKVIRQKLPVRSDVEDFYKFIINDISVKEQNIAFFIEEYNIACYYKHLVGISSFRGNRMHLIQKNATNETNHIIYVGLMGEVREITIEITIIKNDIIFLETQTFLLPFYIEKMNFNEELYIIENYGKYNSYNSTENDLIIIQLYGEFNLTYYHSYNTIDLKYLFNNINGTIIDKRINKVSGRSNLYRLNCSSPCAFKFGYINYRRNIDYLNEGDVRIKYFKTEKFQKEPYTLKISDENKKYFIFYELYGNEEEIIKHRYNYVNFFDINTLTHQLNSESRHGSRVFYYNPKTAHFVKQVYFISYDGVYIKFYLTSNLLYTNIVEGINIFNFEDKEKNFAFKMRRDILYDYVLIKSYSYNKTNNISIFYDVQIIRPYQIDKNGRILCELPIQGINNQKEINIKISNPYNKYHNKIKEDEIIVITLLMPFKNKNFFPIYFDIKYYYNNLVVKIPKKEPKILKLDEEYQIFGEKEQNTSIKNNIILNINKCNINKNYSMYTYYENINNIIWKNNIIDERNIIFHNNVFNNTNIKIEELNGENNSDQIKINSIFPNNYLISDDIYMNYFLVNESLQSIFNDNKITNDYKINYKDLKEKISLKWSPYIDKNIYIPELTIKYNIYIFPLSSKVNSICQMSLIPPNYTVINKTEYSLNIPNGKYKLNLIASVINEEFPLITFYDELEINVSQKYTFIIYIILLTSLAILIIFGISLCLMKKDNDEERRTIDRKYPYSRNSFWISLVQQRESCDKEKSSVNKEEEQKGTMNLFGEDNEDNED